MKKILFIIVCCLMLMATLSAQTVPTTATSDTTRKAVRKYFTLDEAITNTKQSTNSKIRKISLKYLKLYAKAGIPKAMHAMGMVNYTGLDEGKRDFEVAREWFEKANAKDHLKSAYNLAMMYRLGLGVKQDFGKAYQLLCRAGQNGDAHAIYGRGYFHYKGLGCTQSYDSAMTYFRAAAAKEHGYSMFMIGLLYRNGYGVERNNGEANFWLKKAADKKVRASDDELSTDTPENPLQAIQMPSATTKGVQKSKMNKVHHTLKSKDQLQGTYTGTLATYDWSGQYVIKENPLEVTIEQQGNQITASWKEDTLSTVVAKGILTDTALVFTEATYSKRDHYHRTTPATWDFLQATLATVRDGKTINLAGNLQLYSPATKEPGKPMYLNLRSKVSAPQLRAAVAETTHPIAELSAEPMVYPNPFVSQLNVSFYLEDNAACGVSIYNLNGVKVYEEPMGLLAAGTHRYQLQLDLARGSYTVRLTYGDKVYTSMIVKK